MSMTKIPMKSIYSRYVSTCIFVHRYMFNLPYMTIGSTSHLSYQTKLFQNMRSAAAAAVRDLPSGTEGDNLGVYVMRAPVLDYVSPKF